MHMFEVVATLNNGKRLSGILNGRNADEVRSLVRKADGGHDVRTLVVTRLN